MYKKILVATDGSPLSDTAVSHALALAKAVRAQIVALTVSEPFHLLSTEPEQLVDTQEEYRRHVEAKARELLTRVVDAAAAQEVPAESVHLEDDHPYEAIIGTARNFSCDLIVMASHGRRGLSAVVLGSQTVKVLTHSAIPVLVVRDEAREAALRASERSGRPAARFFGSMMEKPD